MEGMDEQLHQQDRIAARCRLIEPQVEGFKVNIILILASLSKQNSYHNHELLYNVHYYNNNSCCSSAYPE